MGMVVRTNTMALNAYRQLGLNNSAVSKSLEKLASGFRINRAGDDAAGFAISEKMKAQITGLETAATNAQNGISLIQTAEGNLSEVHDMLNRMVELATKSANGTYTSTEREALQAEVNQLLDEIDRISQSANFNGAKLLDGTMGMNTNAITNLMGKGAVAASSGKPQGANLISDVHYEAVGNSPTGPTFTVDFGALRVNGERDEEVEISIQVGESTYSITVDGLKIYFWTDKDEGITMNDGTTDITASDTNELADALELTNAQTMAAPLEKYVDLTAAETDEERLHMAIEALTGICCAPSSAIS